MWLDFGAMVAGGVGANYACERWVLKRDKDDTVGFVLVSAGIGLDDLVRVGMVVGAGMLSCALVRMAVGGRS